MARHFAALRMPPPEGGVHFWFYPALAAPWVGLVEWVGLDAYYGFAVINVALLVVAFAVVERRLHWTLAVLLFAGPVVWWADKAHTESFTFSLIAIALASWRDGPPWAMVALGAAATQNPPIALLVPFVGALALMTEPRHLRAPAFWGGAAAAGALALLHPAYYLWSSGTPTPLAQVAAHRGVPTLAEFAAVLWDPNIGLFVHFPALVLIGLASLIVLARLAPARLVCLDLALVVVPSLLFLSAFSQTTNVNHGGTPGMSRYGLWLVPLAVPLLRRAETALSTTRWRAWLAPVLLGSAAWSIAVYHPLRPESYLTPSPLASFLWTRFPALDNPPPEIFTERLSHTEKGRWLPIATPGCEKILLLGRGEGRSVFPVPCAPADVPATCREVDALCYANRSASGYAFARVETSHHAYRFRREAVWGNDVEATLARLLRDVAWWDLRSVSAGEQDNVVRWVAGSESWFTWQGDDRVLVYFAGPATGAEVMLRPPGPMRGAFFAVDTGESIESAQCDVDEWQPCHLGVPGPRGAVLALWRATVD